jgi:hypothetical protein
MSKSENDATMKLFSLALIKKAVKVAFTQYFFYAHSEIKKTVRARESPMT